MAISSTTLSSLRSLGLVVLGSIGTPPINVATAAATPGQFVDFVGAADENDRQHADGHPQEKLQVPQDQLRLFLIMMVLRLAGVENDQPDEVDRQR